MTILDFVKYDESLTLNLYYVETFDHEVFETTEILNVHWLILTMDLILVHLEPKMFRKNPLYLLLRQFQVNFPENKS